MELTTLVAKYPKRPTKETFLTIVDNEMPRMAPLQSDISKPSDVSRKRRLYNAGRLIKSINRLHSSSFLLSVSSDLFHQFEDLEAPEETSYRYIKLQTEKVRGCYSSVGELMFLSLVGFERVFRDFLFFEMFYFQFNFTYT